MCRNLVFTRVQGIIRWLPSESVIPELYCQLDIVTGSLPRSESVWLFSILYTLQTRSTQWGNGYFLTTALLTFTPIMSILSVALRPPDQGVLSCYRQLMINWRRSTRIKISGHRLIIHANQSGILPTPYRRRNQFIPVVISKDVYHAFVRTASLILFIFLSFVSGLV